MLQNAYQYALLLFRKDGSALGSAPVTVDWEPAAECTRVYHARRGGVPLCGEGAASIEPLWDRTEGEPYTRGFRVAFESGGHKVASDFPSAYFTEVAAQASSELVKLGKLAAGETYLFQAVAFARNGTASRRQAWNWKWWRKSPPWNLVESHLDDFQRRS